MSESPFLIIQLICIVGALTFAYLAHRDANKGNGNGTNQGSC